MLLPGLALLLAAMLAPAIGAALFDREPGRPTARCVALFALAGAMQPTRSFWSTGHSLADALTCLSEPRVLTTVWTAAALGWLVAQVAPLAARLLLDAGSTARARRLRARRAHLLEEWTFDPRDQATPISED